MKKLLVIAIALATVAAVTKAKNYIKQDGQSSVLDKKSKSRVFVGQTPPEFVSIGDLWFNSDGR